MSQTIEEENTESTMEIIAIVVGIIVIIGSIIILIILIKEFRKIDAGIASHKAKIKSVMIESMKKEAAKYKRERDFLKVQKLAEKVLEIDPSEYKMSDMIKFIKEEEKGRKKQNYYLSMADHFLKKHDIVNTQKQMDLFKKISDGRAIIEENIMNKRIENEIESMATKACDLYNEEDFDASKEIATKILKVDPDNWIIDLLDTIEENEKKENDK